MTRPNWRQRRRPVATVLVLLAGGAWLLEPAPAQALMKAYETPYYIIHTDLDLEGAREAAVRMTATAEEYHRRTKGFAGKIRRKLPFYLFRHAKDYYAAGGMPGSAGVFDGKKLMAIAGEDTSQQTWHIIQHEAFHQFAASVIRGDIPVWVNEGLAEYFGQGIFTGDGFMVGVVPPGRLQRLKAGINGNQLKPLGKLMQMSYKQWSDEFTDANYDQAWSMIHFLVHADDGKYVKALAAFMNDIGVRRMPYELAWEKNFGKNIAAFQKRYCQWWLAQPDDPTRELRDKAVIATITSFFARACLQKQRFDTAEEFFAAAEAGKLKAHSKHWLPPALLAENLPRAKALGRWAIENAPSGRPVLSCTLGDGRKLIGSYSLGNAGKPKIDVSPGKAGPDKKDHPAGQEQSMQPAETPAPTSRPATSDAPSRPKTDPLAPAIALARAYRDTGLTDKARQVLREALKEHPDSPHRPEAEKLLAELERQSSRAPSRPLPTG